MILFYRMLNEELSKEQIDKHLTKNTAIQFKNKKFKLRGRTTYKGIPISIENYAGDIRAGIDPDGKEWISEMKYSYGFIPNKISADDGEGLDVYLNNDKINSDKVYIVKQHKIEKVKQWETDYCPDCKEIYYDCHCPHFFDEDKIFLGFNNKEEVRQAYQKQYDNPRFLGPISELTIDEFKNILNSKGKGDKIKLPLKYKS